jgi:O-antigen ligase
MRDAGRHLATRGTSRHGFDAVSVLTVFLVLTCAVPSYQSLPALGSLGRPMHVWALFCLLWWMWVRLQRPDPLLSGSRSVRTALLAFAGSVLISYALASFRGLPAGESVTADSGMLRLFGLLGVVLVANDCVLDRDRLLTLYRRIALAGGLMATLGLAQFMTGMQIVDLMQLPGFVNSSPIPGGEERGGYIRAAGTTAHPLEYAVVLATTLPIAVMLAIEETRRHPVARWFPVVSIGLASALSVSRTALIGAAVALLFLIPFWSKKVRLAALGIALIGLAVVYISVPGMAGTIRGMFMTIGSDSSTTSRTDSYDVALEIASHNILFGRGYGTFLPQYRILDNQYLALLIEIGVIGLVGILCLFLAAIMAGVRTRSGARDSMLTSMGPAMAASVAAGSSLMAFFDALSFAISGAMIFLMIGVAGATLGLSRMPSNDVVPTGIRT